MYKVKIGYIMKDSENSIINESLNQLPDPQFSSRQLPYSCENNNFLTLIRRCAFKSLVEYGIMIKGATYFLNQKTYDNLFKDKDILYVMPDDIYDSIYLGNAKRDLNEIAYTNPATNTSVIVDSRNNIIIDIYKQIYKSKCNTVFSGFNEFLSIFINKGSGYAFFGKISVTFRGIKVYINREIFDPFKVDKNGKTNIQRMQSGRAPIGTDGRSINLHHIGQNSQGPLAEILSTQHSGNYSILHQNTGQKPSSINRTIFASFREAYWKDAARRIINNLDNFSEEETPYSIGGCEDE